MSDAVVLVEVNRGGLVESRHRGHLVIWGPEGLRHTWGDVSAPMLPRSALKPLQATGLLRAGLRLDGRHLALACASHSGEPPHARLAADILTRHGLTVRDLRNTPDLPLDPAVRLTHVREGGKETRLHANCSGKHAAILATCLTNDWDRTGHLHPEHPVQQAMLAAIEDLAGEHVAMTTVDGCGAPAHALSLTALARAYSRLATASPDNRDGAPAEAMRRHPLTVGGTGREVSRLIAGVPGLIAKDAADGVAAAAMPDGRVVAIKLDDGDLGGRALFRALTAGLRLAGVTAPVLDELATTPVLGHGHPVGTITAAAFAAPSTAAAHPGAPAAAAH